MIEKGTHNNTWAVDKHNYLKKLKHFMDRANYESQVARMDLNDFRLSKKTGRLSHKYTNDINPEL